MTKTLTNLAVLHAIPRASSPLLVKDRATGVIRAATGQARPLQRMVTVRIGLIRACDDEACVVVSIR